MSTAIFDSLKTRIKNRFIENGWVTVYDQSIEDELIYSAIISPNETGNALQDVSWELHCGSGLPYVSGGIYHSINSEDVEPLVLRRGPWGTIGMYSELTEDFRCYHNLFEKTKNDEKLYYYFDSNGDDELVAKISDKKVVIKHKFLLDYISAKGKNLFVFFDARYKSLSPIDESHFCNEIKTGKNFIYEELVKDSTNEIPPYKSFAMMMGKICIPKIDNYVHDEIWGNIEEHDKFENFAIKYDEDGNEVESTCNPNKCCYLTPVYFKKQVLDKYFQNANKYSVEDGILRCKGAWNIYIDNSNPNYVVVLLGDLGRDLQYKEQKYWKSFNIIPDTFGLSNTAYKRWIDGEFCNSASMDLILKSRYDEFCKFWKNKFGWDFFLPMVPGDEYNFSSLHLLSDADNVQEFDKQILHVVKIFIDSLNENKIELELTEKDEKIKGGISKLESYLSQVNNSNPDLIKFLRNLQNLRSSSVAHRKSRCGNTKVENYFDFKTKNHSEILQDIFKRLIAMLDFLTEVGKSITFDKD